MTIYYHHDDNSSPQTDDDIEISKRQLLAEEEVYQKEKNQLRQLQLNIPILSVSEAIRTNSGMAKVTGMITSRSNISKMKSELTLTCTKCGDSTSRSLNVPISPINIKKENCPRCQKENCVIETDCIYVNAVTVELQDTETFNEIERLHVILFDEDTIDINLGERVVITGQIEIHTESRRQRSHSILFARSVEYEAKEEIIVTPKDKESIERFTIKIKGREKIIDQLVSMFDNSVIGHDHVKKGLLLTSVSTLNVINNFVSRNNNTKRRKYRIHSLIIGEPGLAKTLLLKSTKDLVPKSRYESSQNSSGKSLTAIVSKEDESHVLRLGPVPLAKDAICALNELGRMGLEDQGHLLDVMEEEEFTINKYGINAKIMSPTSIIASANPMNNSRWSNNEKIDLDEIPALKPIIDRFDYVFVVRGLDDENNIRKFINSKSQQEDSLIPEYSCYLKKHIAYARRLNPVFSDEAKSILNESAIKVASKARSNKNGGGGGNIWTRSPRRRDSLYRTAKAIARLKLKDVVNVDDANEAVKFYNVILTQLENTVTIPNDPRYEAYNECITILKQYEKLGGITLYDLFKKACENNQQINDYLIDGERLKQNKSLRTDKNHKTRAVYDILLNNQNVRKVGENPIVLKWSSSSHSSSNIIEIVGEEEPNPSSSSIILPDAPDAPDIQKMDNETKDDEELKENNFSNTKNQMSGMSDMSDRIKATRYSSKGSVYFENDKEKEEEDVK